MASDTDTYCSALLSNTGTSMITFSVNQAACPSVLVKPHSGHIMPGGHQIFFLSTRPVNTVSQQHILPLQLNSYPGYTKVSRGKEKLVRKISSIVLIFFSVLDPHYRWKNLVMPDTPLFPCVSVCWNELYNAQSSVQVPSHPPSAPVCS